MKNTQLDDAEAQKELEGTGKGSGRDVTLVVQREGRKVGSGLSTTLGKDKKYVGLMDCVGGVREAGYAVQ